MSEAMTFDWRPTSAWEGVLSSPPRGGRDDVAPGVKITLLGHADMATLICVRGQETRFAEEIRALWAIDVPTSGRASFGRTCTLVWSGPAQYLAVSDSYDFNALAVGLDGVAAVTDQGDGRAVLEIAGPAARAVLAKGIAIDLDPSVFTPGCVAVTALSHISVQLWQTDAKPSYLLSVPRTVAGHIWHWLCESAAEFGYEIEHRSSL